MSGFAHLKREYIQSLLKAGEAAPSAAPEWIKQQVPPDILARWTKRFYRAERPLAPPIQPRLLNHFSIGADPEFAFQADGENYNADNENLMAGLCFGADNNGRLVELRPAPSRFALEVLASMLSELRWLAQARPNVLKYTWKAGAWSGKDGLGGHVHFGRKKREAFGLELDALTFTQPLLEAAGVVNPVEAKRRLAAGQYGQPLDYRRQRHGWEYRALPSWLDTPLTSYLCLVLSKLAVCAPKHYVEMAKLNNVLEARKRIRNILAEFKGVDDDAYLAYLALDVWGLPSALQYSKDFKASWGLPLAFVSTKLPFALPTVFPPYVEPSEADIQDVFNYMLLGQPIGSPFPSAPKWAFQTVPDGFNALQHLVKTHVAPGLGELVWDVLVPKYSKAIVHFESHQEARINVSSGLLQAGGINYEALRQKFPMFNIRIYPTTEQTIYFYKSALLPNLHAEAKRFLVGGDFPFVCFKDVASFDHAKWRKATRVVKKKVGPRSVVLYQG